MPLAQAADGLALFPPLSTTQFPNTLLTGGINHERTFPFRHDSHPCQDTHDGRHLACRLPAAAFAPQPSAAGDSRNLHGSCVESPCGLGDADAETRCAGVSRSTMSNVKKRILSKADNFLTEMATFLRI